MLNNHNTASNSLSGFKDDVPIDTFREMTESDQAAAHPVPEPASLGITPDLVCRHFNEALEYVRDHIDENNSSPGADFTRQSKFDPVTLMKFLILMGSDSSVCEINKFFSMDEPVLPPHNSAFCEATEETESGGPL